MRERPAADAQVPHSFSKLKCVHTAKWLSPVRKSLRIGTAVLCAFICGKPRKIAYQDGPVKGYRANGARPQTAACGRPSGETTGEYTAEYTGEATGDDTGEITLQTTLMRYGLQCRTTLMRYADSVFA